MSNTGGVRQAIEAAWLAGARWQKTMSNKPIGTRIAERPAAIAKYVESILESLASQPAPSGWQQRIAAMNPVHVPHGCHTRRDGERFCIFCGVVLVFDTTHAPDCLWQNAVDALSPAPEVKDAPAEGATAKPLDESERQQLLVIEKTLRKPRLGFDARLGLADELNIIALPIIVMDSAADALIDAGQKLAKDGEA